MTHKYKTKGTCSKFIEVEMDGDVLKKVNFQGGCDGNLQGITALVEGLSYEDVKSKLSGITCGFKQTSCPDQLVRAMEEAMSNE